MDDLRRLSLHLHLVNALGDLQAQLVRLATAGSSAAVKNLSFHLTAGANELVGLTRSNFGLVQAVASKVSFWPVNYSPHKDYVASLRRMIDRLGVGTASPERPCVKWSDEPTSNQPHRHILGRYAHQIGFTLQRIHFAWELHMILAANPAGWPAWIVQLCQLPELTRTSASDWFAVGWDALTEAAGGSVLKIQELRAVGESNAAYRKRRGDSQKVQERLREKQIRVGLRKAFLARFGS